MKDRAAKLGPTQSERERTRLFCIPARYWRLGRSRTPSPAHHDRTAHPHYVCRVLLRLFLVLARKDYAFAKLTSFRLTMLSYPIGSVLNIDRLALFVYLFFLACCICGSADDRHLGSIYVAWCLLTAVKLFPKQRNYLASLSVTTA